MNNPGTKKIISSVIGDILSREKKGMETYGTTMDRDDLTEIDWLVHTYEEMLDAAIYLKKLIIIKSKSK